MKKSYIFLILAFVYSQELNDSLAINTSKWGGGFSLGACTEKTSISTQEFTLKRYINNQSEIYGSLGSFIIFSINSGIGYKYYFNSRYEPSLFTGISLNSAVSPNSETVSAVNFAFGGSFKSTNFTNFLVGLLMYPILGPVPISENENSFINLGIVLSYNNFFQSNHELRLLPMINLEVKGDW